jgi:hypothetical protein
MYWGHLKRTSSIVLLVFGAALVAAALAGAAGPIANLNVTAMPGGEAEDAIAVNPVHPSNVVAMSTRSDAISGLAVGVSTNAGQTWTRSVIGASTADPLGDICCDQQLAWDRFGNLWMTYLVNSNGNVFVALSTDGGFTFRKVFELQTKFGDQPSIAAGANSVWVSFTASSSQGTQGKNVQAFGARVSGLGRFGAFSATENVPSPGNGDYGDTAVGPAGQVMVTYQNTQNGQGGADVYTAVDPDGLGPAGFATPGKAAHSHVGGFDFIAAQPNRSIDVEANLAWDRSGGAHNGRVYLVWTDENPNESDNTDVMLQHSDDNGATWSPAVRVNDDHTSNSQYDPTISLDQSSGAVGLSWYDTRNDLGIGGSGDLDGIPNDDFQVWATDSTNGGATLAPNFRVSRGTSSAVAANSFFDVGDYTHSAFVGGSFWPAWSDNSNSTGDNPDGTHHAFDLYTARVPIP